MTQSTHTVRSLAVVSALASALTAAPVAANELIFSFTNPSFGGNPLNGTFLFGLAEAQLGATAGEEAAAAAGGGTAGVGGIGGPTLIIPITTGAPQAPTVTTPTTTEATVPQVVTTN